MQSLIHLHPVHRPMIPMRGLRCPGGEMDVREEGLKASKIHADDTPVPVLDLGRGKTATGRLRAYAVEDRASGSSAPPLV